MELREKELVVGYRLSNEIYFFFLFLSGFQFGKTKKQEESIL